MPRSGFVMKKALKGVVTLRSRANVPQAPLRCGSKLASVALTKSRLVECLLGMAVFFLSVVGRRGITKKILFPQVLTPPNVVP